MGTGLSFQPWSTKFRSFLSRLPSADLTGEAQPNFHELHHQDEETNMAMSNGNFFSTEVHLQLWLNWPPRLALGNSLYAKGTVPLNLNILIWKRHFIEDAIFKPPAAPLFQNILIENEQSCLPAVSHLARKSMLALSSTVWNCYVDFQITTSYFLPLCILSCSTSISRLASTRRIT